jgi:predicted glycogen debranching enzyme
MIKLERDICSDFEAATSREWLETNGIGGFAMGTVSGANTRRYHGLLTAALRPPLGRVTLLSKFEETLVIGSSRFELSSNVYPGRVYPDGFKYLIGFRLDPFPIWTYEVAGITLEKRLFMPHGRNVTVCRWAIIDGRATDVSLELRPLISYTDYHHLQHEDRAFDVTFTPLDDVVSIKPYSDLPGLHFTHNGTGVDATGHWFRNFELSIEKERGFDFHEDLFQPFAMKFDLGEPATVIASLDREDLSKANIWDADEITRRSELIERSVQRSAFGTQLVAAADQFIVSRGNGQTIIAGYPWFSDWGRDTMIALPGLTLATGRPEIAKEIILEYSRHISEGMIPNRFPDEGENPDYNTVDATLWYFEAIRQYGESTADHELAESLYEKLADIVAWHLRGTRFNIHIDTDGLLYAGDSSHQLTWMDAKIGDKVITPRTGKPVEIQALWYNALKTMSGLALRLGHDEDHTRFESMADLASLSFNGLFWNENTECLYDVVENGHRDASVRPNQIFAISLFHPVLERDRWTAVLDKVERELLTPFGLRSLSPDDPEFVGKYRGSPLERDSGYHQGTVWGWLIGPFIDAFRKVHCDSEAAVADMLSGFERQMYAAGLGQVSEIFDGTSPHDPRGCPAQAWSVGELLRILNRRS